MRLPVDALPRPREVDRQALLPAAQRSFTRSRPPENEAGAQRAGQEQGGNAVHEAPRRAPEKIKVKVLERGDPPALRHFADDRRGLWMQKHSPERRAVEDVRQHRVAAIRGPVESTELPLR